LKESIVFIGASILVQVLVMSGVSAAILTLTFSIIGLAVVVGRVSEVK
jgi:hypothetical protein